MTSLLFTTLSSSKRGGPRVLWSASAFVTPPVKPRQNVAATLFWNSSPQQRWSFPMARRTLTSSSSLDAHQSQSPTHRTKGVHRDLELEQLRVQLKVESIEALQQLLMDRPVSDATSAKARYIDWLLGRCEVFEEEEEPTVTETQQQQAPPLKKKTPPPKKTTAAAAPSQSSGGVSSDETFLTTQNFATVEGLHPASKRALTETLGLSSMTEIQAKTFAAAASGKDVLGRARTGTGKTLAFLVPAVERLLSTATYTPGQSIGILVISPTRELATQIGDQAEQLLTFHDARMKVQVVFGGTKITTDVKKLQRQLPAILVATPGRLLDHLQSTTLSGSKKKMGRDIMSQTSVVVLDETDRLLDMGFRNEIQKILSYLPPPTETPRPGQALPRQTLLFSATIPPDLKGIMGQTMRKDYIEVDCINDGDAASHTNAQVQQSHVVVPSMDRYLSSVVEVLQQATQQDPQAKIVVFFPTARMVEYFAALFNDGLKFPVWELHSKKSQGYRNRVSEEFRAAADGVLFTSDVSARGVDYPGVSHVIQFGLPESREQYIHRLGRTGRGGKTGQGLLVLGPFESLFLQELKGLDIPANHDVAQVLEQPMSPQVAEWLDTALDPNRQGMKQYRDIAAKAYQAFLGYYLGQMKRIKLRRKDDLVTLANNYSKQMGLKEVPGLTKNMVGKMGLKGVLGLTIKAEDPSSRHGGGGGGGGRYGGGGGGGGGNNQRRGHSNGRRENSDTGRRNRRG